MNTPAVPYEILRDFFGDPLEGGCLADIVAPDANIAAWTRFLDVVVPRYPHDFCLEDLLGNQTTQWPSDRSEVLRLAVSEDGPWPQLSLQLPSVSLRVLVFGIEHVELVVQRQPYNDAVYSQLSDLMTRMSDAMGVDVFLTPESSLSEAALVYERQASIFRRPLHGSGSQTQVRTQVLQAFHGVLRPFIGATRPLSDDLVRAVVDCIEGFSRTYGELALQDALRSEERIEINTAWGSAASIITPPAGVSARAQRPSCEQSLLDQARRIVPNERS